ncbi:uncharacterized protein DDB_G0284459-like isoform X2 [Centruroides sculpturatus]|uniref:uncharacterized protein DDB_G0284459-like isoform X2 n=1 Tax=Centruroides sculpturatus TaxID=218467 RepID=UPI000C6DA57B|nr:uncharacterized protein DDB_G0284459-like isoform X2 [Centruroides sculpturatus]
MSEFGKFSRDHILKEISSTLSERKTLYSKLQNLEEELTSLEKILLTKRNLNEIFKQSPSIENEEHFKKEEIEQKQLAFRESIIIPNFEDRIKTIIKNALMENSSPIQEESTDKLSTTKDFSQGESTINDTSKTLLPKCSLQVINTAKMLKEESHLSPKKNLANGLISHQENITKILSDKKTKSSLNSKLCLEDLKYGKLLHSGTIKLTEVYSPISPSRTPPLSDTECQDYISTVGNINTSLFNIHKNLSLNFESPSQKSLKLSPKSSPEKLQYVELETSGLITPKKSPDDSLSSESGFYDIKNSKQTNFVKEENINASQHSKSPSISSCVDLVQNHQFGISKPRNGFSIKEELLQNILHTEICNLNKESTKNLKRKSVSNNLCPENKMKLYEMAKWNFTKLATSKLNNNQISFKNILGSSGKKKKENHIETSNKIAEQLKIVMPLGMPCKKSNSEENLIKEIKKKCPSSSPSHANNNPKDGHFHCFKTSVKPLPKKGPRTPPDTPPRTPSTSPERQLTPLSYTSKKSPSSSISLSPLSSPCKDSTTLANDNFQDKMTFEDQSSLNINIAKLENHKFPVTTCSGNSQSNINSHTVSVIKPNNLIQNVNVGKVCLSFNTLNSKTSNNLSQQEMMTNLQGDKSNTSENSRQVVVMNNSSGNQATNMNFTSKSNISTGINTSLSWNPHNPPPPPGPPPQLPPLPPMAPPDLQGSSNISEHKTQVHKQMPNGTTMQIVNSFSVPPPNFNMPPPISLQPQVTRVLTQVTSGPSIPSLPNISVPPPNLYPLNLSGIVPRSNLLSTSVSSPFDFRQTSLSIQTRQSNVEQFLSGNHTISIHRPSHPPQVRSSSYLPQISHPGAPMLPSKTGIPPPPPPPPPPQMAPVNFIRPHPYHNLGPNAKHRPMAEWQNDGLMPRIGRREKRRRRSKFVHISLPDRRHFGRGGNGISCHPDENIEMDLYENKNIPFFKIAV